MNDTAEVYLWGTRIGIIHQDITKAYASFEYDQPDTAYRVLLYTQNSLKIHLIGCLRFL